MRPIKRFLAAALLVAAGGSALAQQPYPNRLITIVVPVSLGTGADIVARLFGAKLIERLGASVIVDNKPVAGGLICVPLIALLIAGNAIAAGSHPRPARRRGADARRRVGTWESITPRRRRTCVLAMAASAAFS